MDKIFYPRFLQCLWLYRFQYNIIVEYFFILSSFLIHFLNKDTLPMKKPGKIEYRLILPSFFGRRSGGIPVRLAARDALGDVKKKFYY